MVAVRADHRFSVRYHRPGLGQGHTELIGLVIAFAALVLRRSRPHVRSMRVGFCTFPRGRTGDLRRTLPAMTTFEAGAARAWPSDGTRLMRLKY